MTQNIDAVTMPNVDDSSRVTILIHRRAILLLIIGCTSGNNQALNYVLQNSFLSRIKVWLEDILTNKVGGVDLLLHLLSSITMLPVSKDMVTSSKLGKLVANVEKHKICVGGMNENAIKERVSKVKEEWSASVKRIKKMVSLNDTGNLLFNFPKVSSLILLSNYLYVTIGYNIR